LEASGDSPLAPQLTPKNVPNIARYQNKGENERLSYQHIIRFDFAFSFLLPRSPRTHSSYDHNNDISVSKRDRIIDQFIPQIYFDLLQIEDIYRYSTIND